jgi:coniferyl-alcohol glucosyltransferase
VGLVVPLWAPQAEALRHPSEYHDRGESITNGVPMIAWLLYAEQKINATLLMEELGVAIRSKVLPLKKVVGIQEIEKMVRMIMEDKEVNVIRLCICRQ